MAARRVQMARGRVANISRRIEQWNREEEKAGNGNGKRGKRNGREGSPIISHTQIPSLGFLEIICNLHYLCFRWISRLASGAISQSDLSGFRCEITSGTRDGEHGVTRPSPLMTSLW